MVSTIRFGFIIQCINIWGLFLAKAKSVLQIYTWRYKGDHILPKVNVIARLEFELVY